MSVTRVLGIAPYESMCSLMLQAAESISDVALTACVGNLEEGAHIASQYTEREFDVILSRGGTAELIRQKTNLPVVEIELTPYDILRAIRLAENSNSRYTVVGFPSITRTALILGDILRYEIDLYTIHNEQEARQALEKLSRKGCPMVLCDMITHSLAQEYGLPAILITSGLKSVEEALHQAVDISRIFLPQREKLRMMEAVLFSQAEEWAVFDEKGQRVLACLHATLPETVEKRLDACGLLVLQEGKKRLEFSAGGCIYQLNGQMIKTGEKRYAAVHIQAGRGRSSYEKFGIRYRDKEEIKAHPAYVFSEIVQSAIPPEPGIKDGETLLLAGQTEMDTDCAARLIYAKGKDQNAPLCEIDCALLQEKGWNHLLESNHSPLLENGITLYFRHIANLTEVQFQRLTLSMYDMQLERRSRLIFDCSGSTVQSALSPRCQQLLSRLRSAFICLPPLAQRRNEIPHLAGMYISVLNMRSAKEIAGLEEGAMQLMLHYDWPAGYEQLRRVLEELVESASSAYILEADTWPVINREKRLYAHQPALPFPDMIRGKNLEEIEQMAVQWALAEYGGNQSAAARQLGIGRTTLWRMLHAGNESCFPSKK